MKNHPFWQAVGLLVLAYVVVVFGIPLLPGSAIVPKSVVLQYMATVFVGVNNGVLGAATLIVGGLTYSQVKASVAAPPNLRSIHPAPPASITFRGKTMTLAGLENPLRASTGAELAQHLAVGRRVYYQNCVPCHGDHLDGQGHYANGFNPIPLSFQDNGTIAQLTESFVFWRVAKGGPGLPREATPWNSAMPAWEDFLTEDEVWSVILFLYDQTGWKPRTWEKAEGRSP